MGRSGSNDSPNCKIFSERRRAARSESKMKRKSIFCPPTQQHCSFNRTIPHLGDQCQKDWHEQLCSQLAGLPPYSSAADAPRLIYFFTGGKQTTLMTCRRGRPHPRHLWYTRRACHSLPGPVARHFSVLAAVKNKRLHGVSPARAACRPSASRHGADRWR